MRLLVLSNHYNTLRIFRRELLITLSEMGHEIIVSLPPTDEENIKIIESYGCNVVIEPMMDRRAINPIKDLLLFADYFRLIKKVKPDKVIAYTVKCNIYGGEVCKLLNIPFYANITGLGSAFQSESKTKKVLSVMYKISLKKAKKIFFENCGNRNKLISSNIVDANKTIVLAGAGVNLNEFPFKEYPDDSDKLIFIFVGRIMKEKGVDELLYAIKRLNSEGYNNLEFHFIGWYEDDYQSVVEELHKQGLIKFFGFQADVKPYIEKSHCVILPSWHEGMSNTLLEGASIGRPLITSNIHGCMEAVEEGKTGLLFKVKDKESLYNVIKQFIEMSSEERKNMAYNGRKLMEERFDKKNVVDKTIHEIFS